MIKHSGAPQLGRQSCGGGAPEVEHQSSGATLAKQSPEKKKEVDVKQTYTEVTNSG